MSLLDRIRSAFARDPVTWGEVGRVVGFWLVAGEAFQGLSLLVLWMNDVENLSVVAYGLSGTNYVAFALPSLALRRVAPTWVVAPAHPLTFLGVCLGFVATSVCVVLWTSGAYLVIDAVLPSAGFRGPSVLDPAIYPWAVSNSFWQYLLMVGYYTARAYRVRLSEQERAAVALEAELARAQVETLRMQLNPHFLFNALNVISGLVGERPGQARDAIAQLSSLLRGALAGSSAQATLRDELAWLERYLDLQRLRFEDRLDVDLDIHPDTVDARVPSFLLQPLVENAFKHGVARVSRQGHVTICAQRDGDRLVLDVLDNGPGLASVGGDGSSGAAPSIGLGVTTTRDRLGRLYGDAATLDLTDRADGVGVRARVVIPFQTVAPPVHA